MGGTNPSPMQSSASHQSFAEVPPNSPPYSKHSSLMGCTQPCPWRWWMSQEEEGMDLRGPYSRALRRKESPAPHDSPTARKKVMMAPASSLSFGKTRLGARHMVSETK